MTKQTPQEVAAKLAARLKASTTEIQNQVMKVQEAPGIGAAKKSAKMLQNVTEAVNSGKWGRAVSAVSLNDWQQAMIRKGIPRISQGVDAAIPKIEAFFAELLPYIDTVQAKIDQMPDLTLEDGINRMVENARQMANFKRQRR